MAPSQTTGSSSASSAALPPGSGDPMQQLVQLLTQHWPAIAVGLAVVAALQLLLTRLMAPTSGSKPRGKGGKPFLDPAIYQPLPLGEKTYITHNTVRLRFDLPSPTQRLGLPVGQHISFLAKDADGKDVYRSYTPVSDDDQLGSVTFVIKVYPQGKMSQAIANLKVGDTMLFKGPKGRLSYTPNMKKHIGMLAGGTGVTPMYQVLCAILKNPSDKTQVKLIFGNITEEDILLREELDSLVAAHPGRLQVHYVLDKPPAGWTGGSGYINQAMVQAHLPAPGPETLILRCGPLPMMDAMKRVLDAAGYSEEQQFQF